MTAPAARHLVDRKLFTELSANPDATPLRPRQVVNVRRRENLAQLLTADTPSGRSRPQPGTAYTDFDHMVRLGRTHSPQPTDARFKTSRAEAIDIPLYTTASADTVTPAHPEADREQLPTIDKSRCPPLASPHPAPTPAPA
ncbi:hypothetical protein OG936_00465 [Streptomyces sp. NBC_00846]|uniref:hypothetical protein n=1 Tax=Streptomyces sp. NBC_00846 TaxID=2975849 RepID=UPI00386CF5F6|nr:hypothetical protein OG936_00465 [Streptomyces sp. NBC_00846]